MNSPTFPTRESILAFIEQNPGITKQDIAKTYAVKGGARVILKEILRELEAEQAITRNKGRYRVGVATAPTTLIVECTGLDADGEMRCVPVEPWPLNLPEPVIILGNPGKGEAPGEGDHVLVRLTADDSIDDLYIADAIKLLHKHEKQEPILGVYLQQGAHGIVEPVSKRLRQSYAIAERDRMGAQDGALVWIEVLNPGKASRRLGMADAKVVENLGDIASGRAISSIAMTEREIPHAFPEDALQEAEAAEEPTLTADRTDLREYPLVTIDGIDARDFDDAVFAEPDSNPNNAGGWHLLVAIADVAHYVLSGSALDEEAFLRGNSVYFPDRVVPMLPEALSNGLCSLRPHEPRYCMAIHMWIDKRGRLLDKKLVRGLMHSRARLTYEQVQAAMDGTATGKDAELTTPLLDTVIRPLYGAYACLNRFRMDRGALDLDLPEMKVILDDAGNITQIGTRERLDSHKLIEEFMICANVAAAQLIKNSKIPALHRVHEAPDTQKIHDLNRFLEGFELSIFAGDGVQARHFNKLLEKVAESEIAPVINMAVLRAQMQAFYGTDLIGHFGLGLQDYAHFTSPIRRYSDLILHRALIRAYHLGDDGLSDIDMQELETIGEHISMTERRAMMAERDTLDRYMAKYLQNHLDEVFEGVISGVTEFGMFVTLKGLGATGLIPLRTLSDDFYVYDKGSQTLTGRRRGGSFHLGQQVVTRLLEASPATGSLKLELLREDTGSGHKARKGGERKQRDDSYAGRRAGNPKDRYKQQKTDRKYQKYVRDFTEEDAESAREGSGRHAAARSFHKDNPYSEPYRGERKRKGVASAFRRDEEAPRGDYERKEKRPPFRRDERNDTREDHTPRPQRQSHAPHEGGERTPRSYKGSKPRVERAEDDGYFDKRKPYRGEKPPRDDQASGKKTYSKGDAPRAARADKAAKYTTSAKGRTGGGKAPGASFSGKPAGRSGSKSSGGKGGFGGKKGR